MLDQKVKQTSREFAKLLICTGSFVAESRYIAHSLFTLMTPRLHQWYSALRSRLKVVLKSGAEQLTTDSGNIFQHLEPFLKAHGTMALSAKVLSTGSPLPPIEKGVTRLYSMRFCPFAHRARLVLAHKNVEYQTVNIHLGKKPEWFFEKNPNGEVPVLEKDGRIVYDSLVVAEYLDSVYKKDPLVPEDPYCKAQDDMIINYNGSKFVPNYYKIINTKGEDKDAVDTMMKALQKFEDVLTERGSKFFGGDRPAFVDLMIWPWQERFSILGKYPLVDTSMSKFPRLKEWQALMKEIPAVKECAQTDEMHDKFVVQWKGGDENPFDVGLN
ncbi:glutathione S-transferase omega-1-like [Babylonia areolata]|uniref:glutathione S-transferase omega-1-like n=1 Tax=Babylonia areolata TaxID=304850 RepID=UPI003FD3C76B